MKKFYSILLAAVSLLFSANLSAVDVTTRQQIQDAINDATEGQTVNILLKSAISVDATINIEGGQVVNIDLNGYNMTAGNPMVFQLTHGTLNIIGTGTIDKTGNSKSDAIRVYGSIVPTDKNYSNLLIGENVTVSAHGPQSSGKETTNAITVIEKASSPETSKAAYGVNIEIKGKVYGSKYGVKINGSITQNVYSTEEGNKYDNRPYVHITSTAEVWSEPSTSNSIAVYSSGVGRILIEGYVHGATGVCVKGGIVDLNDAIVKSDYKGDYSDPEARKKANGTAIVSGIEAGGSAIVIASQDGYPGGQEVTISGDTKVTGGSGFAIDEALLVGGTKVESVEIQGGTIEAGTKGAMIFTDETVKKDDENTVTVIGGNFKGGIDIREHDGTTTTETVTNFVPKDGDGNPIGNYSTTSITDSETGKTTIVVTKLEDGVSIDTPEEGESNSVVGTASGAENGLKWILKTADQTDPTKNTETLTENKTLAYLEINNTYNQTLNVGDKDNNVTLTVGRIVLGENAKIVVAAGSRLIVDGEQGIVATNNDNLVFGTKEGKTAQFLFNPAVTSNRHPNATVEFESKSYYNSSADFRNQRFGIPTVGKLDAITSSNDIPVAFAAYVNGTWTNIGRINATPAVDLNANLNEPFVYYQMSCNITKEAAETSRPVITMKGSLVGNESPELETSTNTFTTFANSYMANLGLTPLYDALDAADGVDKILYTYRPVASNTFAWKGYNRTIIAFEERALEPMQAFYVKNNGNVATIALNYTDMVWNKRNAEFEELTDAPARRAADNRYDVMAQMSVKANGEVLDDIFMLQSDRFTADYEDGWDGEKMMNDDVNFFVMGNVRQEAFATDNLNNTYLGFSCQTAGEYTISFGRMSGNDLVLVDLVNGKRVNIVEGGEYTFLADAAESNDYRFQIVGRANMPTDVEEVEAAVKGNGIYSLTGQYMGNMSVWNTLPAGVYVVDGVKRVK